MDIYIVTHGRANKQTTYGELPPSVQERVTFVVQDSEKHLWESHPNKVLVLPPHITTIAPTRQYLVDNTPGKLCMLDDDLTFSVRRHDEPTKFRAPVPGELESVFGDIESALSMYTHVGISGREGANRDTEKYRYNTRFTRVLALRADILREEGVRYGRMEFMTDFDVNLQLLRLGHQSLILNYVVQNQGGSNAPGGCSTVRNHKNLAESAFALAEYHPGFVKVSRKKTKDLWCADDKGFRTDVTIQWKKALASAQEKRP